MKKGFAYIDPIQLREICSRGGKAVHASGRAHEFTSVTGKVAGRIGGKKHSREHMAEIGRVGGKKHSKEHMVEIRKVDIVNSIKYDDNDKKLE